ncbi:MAG: hypothetical protein AB1817_12285 [Chloroflexota bacterium]
MTLRYCPRLSETLDRLRRLYEERAQDIILASVQIPSPALTEYAAQRAPGICDYPDPQARANFWDAYLRERAAIYDDTIPSAYLSEMDQGLYGALVGGEPQFIFDSERGWVSSMVAPILRNWSEFERLGFNTAHPWFQRYLKQLQIFVETARGKFGVSHFVLIDGLNFVFELVGATQTYLSLLDHPELVDRAIALAFEINTRVQRAFFDHAPLLEGGTCSNFAQWLPGRIVSESVDPFHLTSVKYFERWGRANVEKMFAQFDGGVIHIHGNGRHLIDAVRTVAGLKALALLDDEGFPLAFDILPEIKKRTGDLPLIVKVNFAQFSRALEEHKLPGGVSFKVQNAPDAAAANRCAELVRAYRN